MSCVDYYCILKHFSWFRTTQKSKRISFIYVIYKWYYIVSRRKLLYFATVYCITFVDLCFESVRRRSPISVMRTSETLSSEMICNNI